LNNIFILEPLLAEQDVLEVNFGFYVEKVAGVTIEDASKKDRMEVQEETKKEEKADSSECKAME